MPTKKLVQTFLLLMMPSAILWLHAQTSQNVPGMTLDRLELHNAKAEAVNYKGKPAVRVDALPDAANGTSYAILKGSRFHNGTIEVELAGKPGANAGPGARGFIGTTRPSTLRTRNSISTDCGRNRQRNMNRMWTWNLGCGRSTGS